VSKLPYGEGTWFAVPLKDGGYGVGLVARIAPRGRVLLGYFFGPRLSAPPTLEEVGHLNAGDAVLIQRFGDVYLVEGRWPIIGQQASWTRSAWPMPAFGRYVELDGKGWRVEYQDNNPNSVPRESRISPEAVQRLPNNALLGAGVVEATLTKRLSGSAGASSRAN
jgi:Immunity protein 26